MRLDAAVGDRTWRVEVRPEGGGRFVVRLDDDVLDVDFVVTGDGFASLLVNGHSHEVGLEARENGTFRVHLAGEAVTVALAETLRHGGAPARRPSGPQRVTAPMPGRVVRVLAAEGGDVEPGQALVVIEAMKMENELKAPAGGRVRQVAVHEGQAVEAGALLVVVG